jgi:hypothetical protein
LWPCEALGPKIQGGIEAKEPELYVFSLWPDVIEDPRLVPGYTHADDLYNSVYAFLTETAIEGIVWHGEGGKMAKIKRRDFGLEWPPRSIPEFASGNDG